jgi:hypothetical protein
MVEEPECSTALTPKHTSRHNNNNNNNNKDKVKWEKYDKSHKYVRDPSINFQLWNSEMDVYRPREPPNQNEDLTHKV